MTSRLVESARLRAGVVVVVVVERNACVVALDEAARGRVVVIGGQRQAGILAQVVDGLHQALAEGGFADDQRAVVILQRAGDDLSRRSGAAVDQHDDGEGLAVVAVGRGVVLVGIGAAALRDDGLALGQQVVADVDCLAQQAAGIAAQIEHQSLQVGEAVDGVVHFLGGGLLELGEVDVADAGTNLVFQIDRGMRNLVAHQVEDAAAWTGRRESWSPARGCPWGL